MTFNDPFTHSIIRDFVPAELALAAFHETPPSNWEGWIRYDNDCEHRKLACDNLPSWKYLSHRMTSGHDPSLTPDFRGAGCHVIEPGGWLQPHLDYALHPNGLERRVNIVLYLNPEWKEEWGGRLELCNMIGEPVKNIHPAFNTAVIWECSDISMHAVSEITGPERRVLAAVNYLGPNRCATRRRAMFLPKR